MAASPVASQRDSWATRLGFILAAVGSAVGLGNMWRFPYVASEGGGAVFVALYLVIVAVVGIPLMTAEFVVGRLTQQSPLVAVRRLGGPWWAPLGWLFIACGFGILSYYSVIAGWTMRYAFDAVRNAIPSDTSGYFNEVSSGLDAVGLHLLFMAVTIWIVVQGVRKGLERSVLVMMPVLFLLLIGLALWAKTLDGGDPGYGYYLRPDLEALFRPFRVRFLSFDLYLFRPGILAAAAGQAFYSLSLGMGALMTYASYLRSKENLSGEATVVALSDFGVAFVAGLVVFPVIFAFDLFDTVSESSIGTLFIALPKGFEILGRTGDFVDTAFFVLLFLAALSSAISLLEVVVTAMIDRWGWRRGRATLVAGGAITLLGVPSALDLDVLGAMDQLTGNFLLLVGGLGIAFFVGWRIFPQADAELAQGLESPGLRRTWRVLVRFVAPVVLVAVLVSAWPATWTAVRTLLGLG
jgi:NSS family neurotransmitter:Na+ symporter